MPFSLFLSRKFGLYLAPAFSPACRSSGSHGFSRRTVLLGLLCCLCCALPPGDISYNSTGGEQEGQTKKRVFLPCRTLSEVKHMSLEWTRIILRNSSKIIVQCIRSLQIKVHDTKSMGCLNWALRLTYHLSDGRQSSSCWLSVFPVNSYQAVASVWLR